MYSTAPVERLPFRRHIAEVIWTAEPSLGGITGSLPDFTDALCSEGRYDSKILAVVGNRKQGLMRDLHKETVTFPSGMLRWLCQRRLHARMREIAKEAAVIHIHGLWREHGLAATSAARKLSIPYVYSAHSMLNEQALRNKRLKKLIYAALFERRCLGGASALRALTRFEMEAYRKFGIKVPIIVVPNGVHLPKDSSSKAFFDNFPALIGKQLILYMGRLHPYKCPDVLVRAWSKMAARFPDAHLVLAGPDEVGTKDSLVRLAEECGIKTRVTFTGNLNGETKWGALNAADVFVLPSRSEGLSMALLEALACSRPVILTRGCNFPEVEAHQAGLIIDHDENHLERALTDVLRLSPRERFDMGARGRELVKSKYTWASVARSMADVYDWLLGGNRPSTVEIYDR